MSHRTRDSAIAWLLAIGIVVAVELAVFGLGGPWDELAKRMPAGGCGPQNGVVADRVALRELAHVPPMVARSFVVGSSRACEGFHIHVLSAEEREGIVFTKLAHAAVTPIAIRSLVPVVEESGASAVAVLLSEFDTHGPLVLVPEASFGGLSFLADVGRLVGRKFVRGKRTWFYRYAAAGLLRSYLYRRVWGEAGLDDARGFRFQTDAELETEPGGRSRLKPRALSERRASLGADPRGLMPGERFHQIRDNIIATFPRKIPLAEFHQLRVLARGEHVSVQMGLLEASFARWRDSGIEVVIVEGPLNPLGAPLYDPTLRDDFVDFAERMERDYGVHFVPIDRAAPYQLDDFKDLTHLSQSGQIRLSREIASVLRSVSGLGPKTP